MSSTVVWTLRAVAWLLYMYRTQMLLNFLSVCYSCAKTNLVSTTLRIKRNKNGAWPKRRQTKTTKAKTATRDGCTVRGLQALISCIDCETIDVYLNCIISVSDAGKKQYLLQLLSYDSLYVWRIFPFIPLLLTSNLLEGITVNRTRVCCPINQISCRRVDQSVNFLQAFCSPLSPFWPHVFVVVLTTRL